MKSTFYLITFFLFFAAHSQSNSTNQKTLEEIAYSRPYTELRDEPNLKGKVLAILPENTKLLLLQKIDRYYKVNASGYGEGYISTVWIKHIPSSSSTTIKSKSSSTKNYKPTSKTRYRASRRYYRGPRGGCYYINSNGNKTYVDRSFCN